MVAGQAAPRQLTGGCHCARRYTGVAYVRHMPRRAAPLASTQRSVRLFRNGRNQAVRIPRELELPGREATLRKEGSRLILEPLAAPSLLAVLEGLEPLGDDLPPVPRPAAKPVVI